MRYRRSHRSGVRFNGKTEMFRVTVDGKTVGHFEEIEVISRGRTLFRRCTNFTKAGQAVVRDFPL